MSQLSPTAPAAERGASAERLAQIDQLRDRMRRIERSAPARRELDTLEPLRAVVRLQAGGVYQVDPADAGLSLAWGLLAGPSAAGEWGTVVGFPEFGVEAAAALGVRLERLICVPAPGEHWAETVAALIDVVTVVVVRPPRSVSEAVAAKLTARLRTREAALIAVGPWPRPDLRLSASQPRWVGAGAGEGHLRSRRLSVEARRGASPVQRVEMWFPAEDLSVSSVGFGAVSHPAFRSGVSA